MLLQRKKRESNLLRGTRRECGGVQEPMRCLVSFVESSAVLLVFLTATAFDQGHSFRTAGKCGKPVTGIALCLSRSAEPDAMLEVRNTSPKDAVLNLGIMLANGARQYPTALPCC